MRLPLKQQWHAVAKQFIRQHTGRSSNNTAHNDIQTNSAGGSAHPAALLIPAARHLALHRLGVVKHARRSLLRHQQHQQHQCLQSLQCSTS